MPKNVKSVKYNGISVVSNISRKELDNVAEHHGLNKGQANAFWDEVQKAVKEAAAGEAKPDDK